VSLSRRIYPILWLGFTLILAGYLMVWLPQPVVGLSLLGLEMGEWVKFLPEMQTGLLPDRNLFYLPPILLALMMIVWTADLPNGRWQTWALRGLAFSAAFLSFPSIEAIRDEPSDQWLLRLALIGLVGLAAILSGFLKKLPSKILTLLLLITAVTNIYLPGWAYLSIRPVIANLLRTDIGMGPGLILHTTGNVFIILAAVYLLAQRPEAEAPVLTR
jgi:hypothetical protein